MTALPTEYLPPLALELIDVMGVAAAERFIAAYRGRRLEIPRGKRQRGLDAIDKIAEHIGEQATKRLVARYRGTVLPVPKCHAAMRAVRDAALQARFDELTGPVGMSARGAVALLVQEFDLVESSIWRALKRSPSSSISRASATTNQTNLF